MVPPAPPARALGSGVVQCSKLLGSFLQAEQKTRQVADDQGMQEGFSTGLGTSPVLPPPRAGGSDWPCVVPSASAKPCQLFVLQVPTLLPLALLPGQQRLPGPEPPAHSTGSFWLLSLLLFNVGLISLTLH